MVGENMLPIVSDKEIDSLLDDAFLNSVRNTDAYKLGCVEERQRISSDALKQAFENMCYPAEIFYHAAKKQFPKLIIKQIRIGLDYKTGLPAVLMIIDEKNEMLLSELRLIARSIEKLLWLKDQIEGHLWSRTDSCIEQNLVNQDFPYFRVTK